MNARHPRQEGRSLSERCMVKAGGPCQGPGKLPNTVCGETEISDSCSWRVGGKFKPEYQGNACCTKRPCRIYLGVIQDPKAVASQPAATATATAAPPTAPPAAPPVASTPPASHATAATATAIFTEPIAAIAISAATYRRRRRSHRRRSRRRPVPCWDADDGAPRDDTEVPQAQADRP